MREEEKKLWRKNADNIFGGTNEYWWVVIGIAAMQINLFVRLPVWVNVLTFVGQFKAEDPQKKNS